MTKISIPNRTGHYELDGFEVDVSDRDIIIRTSRDKENREYTREKEPPKTQKPKDEPYVGPITGMILGKVGIDVPHR